MIESRLKEPLLLQLILLVKYGSLLHRKKPYRCPQKAKSFTKFMVYLIISQLPQSEEELVLVSIKRRN